MRDTVVIADCLGPNALLKPGDVQKMNFQPGDDIHAWRGQKKPAKEDVKIMKAKKNKDGTFGAPVEHVIEGYMG